jgi:large subunit ribosomal protein L30e
MKKNAMEENLRLIKTKVQEGKAVIGSASVMKSLNSNSLKKIFLAKNCPDNLRSDILHYAELAEVPVIELEQTNEELGVLCKKNFLISAVGTVED